MTPEALRTLEAIDWDFALPRSGYVTPLHWYPGTFVPALSTALTEALAPAGGIVFDPYCGIGTTGWSAARVGRSSILTDANPVAVLTAWSSSALLALMRADRPRALAALGTLERYGAPGERLLVEHDGGGEVLGLDGSLVGLVTDPARMLAQVTGSAPIWGPLEAWVAPETLRDLMATTGAVLRSGSAALKLLGLCMVSASVRNVGSQHASWGHIADNVRPREFTKHDVGQACRRWVARARSFLRQPAPANPGRPSTTDVERLDWTEPPAREERLADLLLTSPPYADAIDYTLAQRLSLHLLGHDEEALRRLVVGEIGARRKRAKSTSRSDWSAQLCEAMIRQAAWLKPGAPICLVLPHKDSGRSGGEDALKETITKLGRRLVFERDRSIHQSHTRQSWTSIKRETILVFAPSC